MRRPPQKFRVIHPFHPLRGRQFELVSYGHTWGEHRVYFHDRQGRVVALPASWTDALATDPFVEVAAGRCYFRLEDLVKLSDLVEALKR